MWYYNYMSKKNKGKNRNFLIPIFLFAVIGTLFINFLQETYFCNAIENCKIWGSFWIILWENIAIGFIGTIYFFLLKSSKLKKWRKALHAIIILISFIYLFMIFKSFNTYIKTMDNYLEINNGIKNSLDPSIHIGSRRIKYDEIRNILISWRIGQGLGGHIACMNIQYIQLKNGISYRISDFGAPWQDLSYYLHNIKGIVINEAIHGVGVKCPRQ